MVLRGIKHPGASDAILIHCQIDKVLGDSAPHFTADAWGKEYAKGVERAATRYKNRWVVLIGEIDRVEFNQAGAADVTFKTADRFPRVSACFSAIGRHEVELNKKLKPGQFVRVIGEYSFTNSSPDEVQLLTCLLMDNPR